MKKITATILAALLFSMIMSGCVNETNVSNEKGETNDSSPDYVVNIDDSFDSGVELEKARETLSPEEADFRNLKWGMTKDEVIYVEGGGAREPQENVLYYTRVREEGYPADAEYTFEDGKLVQGVFYIKENTENKSISLDDYDALVALLSERYGEADIIDKRFVTDEIKTEDREKMMKLVLTNEFNYKTGWSLDNTELSVILFQKDKVACIGLRYLDKNASQGE